jgi:hypothetical protein
MRLGSTFLVVVLFLLGCETRRGSLRSSPPPGPQCTVAMPAASYTDVTCRGALSRELLWHAALVKAAETGPDHGALTFEVLETNEAQGWRIVRAKFPTATEPAGPYSVERLLTPQQLEAGRLRATTRLCQRAVITNDTDPQTRASCLQFLSTQQQLAQSERHHSEQLAVQRVQAEAQAQQAAAASAAMAPPPPQASVSVWGSGSSGSTSMSGGVRATGAPAPECRLGSDGINTCGYNCRLGSNGRFYCASVPNGQCSLNSNGTWSCP